MKISKGEWIIFFLTIVVLTISFITVFCGSNGIIGG